jgi:ABC-type Co2+ transport system permease subunit
MVLAVARALGLSGGVIPLAMAGSFLLGADTVSHALIKRIVEDGFDVVASKVAEPVRGALILAGRAPHDGEDVR